MANTLQDYFSRLTAVNRQRGMTGNMQYNKTLDPAISEGYFDSYFKNKQASQAQANASRGLDISEKGLNATIANQDWNRGFQEKGQAADISYKDRALAAQTEYNTAMLGYRGIEIANADKYNTGRLALDTTSATNLHDYQDASLASTSAYQTGTLENQRSATASQNLWGGIGAALNVAGFGTAAWLKNKDINSRKSPESGSNDAYYSTLYNTTYDKSGYIPGEGMDKYGSSNYLAPALNLNTQPNWQAPMQPYGDYGSYTAPTEFNQYAFDSGAGTLPFQFLPDFSWIGDIGEFFNVDWSF
jgi:hypothetical protein